MKTITLFALFLSLYSHIVFSQTITAGNYSFTLDGSWSKNVQAEILVFTKQEANIDQQRQLIFTPFPVQGPLKDAEIMLSVRQHLESLSGQFSGLIKVKDIENWESNVHLLHTFSVYKTRAGTYLIGTSVNTNRGILMVTLEGKGTTDEGLKEMQEILNSLKF